MARADLLVKLIKGAVANDLDVVDTTTEQIITEERAKQHHPLADRLEKALIRPPERHSSAYQFNKPPNGSSPAANSQRKDVLAERIPRRRLADLVLPPGCLSQCRELIEEQHRADLLRSHGLEPRHSALLIGPPGNGKTSLAEALAYELGVAFFVVRYETVVSSFLGETSGRLKQIFDYVRTVPCVLFFDEFDTLGKEGGDTGEIKRVVSALLLQIDDLPSSTVVITATNHHELLDRAVWRRFQIKMELPIPDNRSLYNYFDKFFSRYAEPAGFSMSDLSKRLLGLSFAEAEEFCLDIQRRFVLSMGQERLQNIVDSRLHVWGEQPARRRENAGGGCYRLYLFRARVAGAGRENVQHAACLQHPRGLAPQGLHAVQAVL